MHVLSTPLRFSIPTCSAGGSIPKGTCFSVAKDQASKESRRCPNRGDACTPLPSGIRYSERTRASRSEQWGDSEEQFNISAVGEFLKKESASFRSLEKLGRASPAARKHAACSGCRRTGRSSCA